jgi:flagellar motility protein MotE (MotC chaperone)
MEFWGRHIFYPQPTRHRHGAHKRHDHRTGPLGRESRGADFAGRSSWLSAVVVGIGVTLALSWATVHLVQAWAEQGVEPQPAQAHDLLPGSASAELSTISGTELATPVAEPVQGPALIVPEEIIAMFQQRQQDLERREKAVRTAEGQLAILKAEVEAILAKVEAIEQRRLGQEKAALGQQASHKDTAELRTQRLGQLAKMYESMPAEEAAARIERMADRKALEILRLLKSKSAGAILAQVKVDRAAKLTEELLATP